MSPSMTSLELKETQRVLSGREPPSVAYSETCALGLGFLMR